MEHLLGVGGPRAPIVATGWDVWPLVAMVTAAWVARRFLGMRWGTPLLIVIAAAALLLPLAIDAWGVIPAFAVALALALIARPALRRDPGHSSDPV